MNIYLQAYRDSLLNSPHTHQDAYVPLYVASPEGDRCRVLEVYKRFSMGDHIILTGEPGSGKSTALQQLRKALAEDGLIPVLVKLGRNKPIMELIEDEFSLSSDATQDQIGNWLMTDQLVLLLDGINEISSDDLLRELIYFREQNFSTPMIFTTRDTEIGGDLGIKKQLTIEPLSDFDISMIAARQSIETDVFLCQVTKDYLMDIAKVPLFASILCDIFNRAGRIPDDPILVARQITEGYDRFKGYSPSISEDSRRMRTEMLQYVALLIAREHPSPSSDTKMSIDCQLAAHKIEVLLRERGASNPLTSSYKWLDDLLRYHLVQPVDRGRNIEFCHPLFQRYYARSGHQALSGFFGGPHHIELLYFSRGVMD